MKKAFFLFIAFSMCLIIGCESRSDNSASLKKEMEEMQGEIDKLKGEIKKLEKDQAVYEPSNKSDLYTYTQNQPENSQLSQSDIFVPDDQASNWKVEKPSPSKCFTCSGSGSIKCTSCMGTGSGGLLECFLCNGTGRDLADFRCSRCNGTGYGTCSWCFGEGQSRCYSCGGSGEW